MKETKIFKLDSNKADEFMDNDNSKAIKAMSRFKEHGGYVNGKLKTLNIDSDLISRSALLEDFKKCYVGRLGIENSDYMMTLKSICKIINEQPTAYVDNVMEQLEECKKFSLEHDKDDYFLGATMAFRKAIEIVKNGGK